MIRTKNFRLTSGPVLRRRNKARLIGVLGIIGMILGVALVAGFASSNGQLNVNDGDGSIFTSTTLLTPSGTNTSTLWFSNSGNSSFGWNTDIVSGVFPIESHTRFGGGGNGYADFRRTNMANDGSTVANTDHWPTQYNGGDFSIGGNINTYNGSLFFDSYASIFWDGSDQDSSHSIAVWQDRETSSNLASASSWQDRSQDGSFQSTLLEGLAIAPGSSVFGSEYTSTFDPVLIQTWSCGAIDTNIGDECFSYGFGGPGGDSSDGGIPN